MVHCFVVHSKKFPFALCFLVGYITFTLLLKSLLPLHCLLKSQLYYCTSWNHSNFLSKAPLPFHFSIEYVFFVKFAFEISLSPLSVEIATFSLLFEKKNSTFSSVYIEISTCSSLLCKNLFVLSPRFSFKSSAFSPLFNRNLHFLFTFLLKSLLPLQSHKSPVFSLINLHHIFFFLCWRTPGESQSPELQTELKKWKPKYQGLRPLYKGWKVTIGKVEADQS